MIAIAFAIFLFGGGLYIIINKPLPAVYYNQRFYFLYPQLSEEFIFDMVTATILYTLGLAGLLAVYQSTKSAYNPRQAHMTFVIGFTLLLLAFLLIEVMIRIKTGQ